MQVSQLGIDLHISDMTMLAYVLQGIRRSQAATGGNNPRPRLPITAGVMRLLKAVWQSCSVTYNTGMLWAVSCTCFFRFLRSGEATVPNHSTFDPAVHLSMSDIAMNSRLEPSLVMINIKAFKTDPFRKGVTTYLGKMDNDLCPVGALLSYVHRSSGS